MKEFSGVKLTITILCTVIIMAFLGSISLFIDAGIKLTEVNIIDELYDSAKYSDDESSEKAIDALTEIGENLESQIESIEEDFEEDKEILGEDFPVEGLFLYRLISVCQSNEIVTTFEWCFGLGIVIGIGIYIIVIQRATGKKLIKELIIAAIALVLIILILMLGYEAIFNLAVELEGLHFTTSNDYFFILKMLLIYIVSIVVIYIINHIYEKLLIKKCDESQEKPENKKEEKGVKRKTTKSETTKKKTTAKKTTSKKENKSKESK